MNQKQTMKTTLRLLERAPLNEALDHLEELISSHPAQPGEQIPFHEIPLMEPGTPIMRFAVMWDTRVRQATREQLVRMFKAQPWLQSVGAIPPCVTQVTHL